MADPTPAATGDLYHGFLIAPEDSERLGEVRAPRLSAATSLENLESDGDTRLMAAPVRDRVASPAALAGQLPFPMYRLKRPPAGSTLAAPSITRDNSGVIVSVSVSYETYTEWMGRSVKEASISISALTEFPRPFPLVVSGKGPPSGRKTVGPERVAYLPAPGVRVRTAHGAAFHWIENDVLYTLRVENDASLREAATIARSLTRTTE